MDCKQRIRDIIEIRLHNLGLRQKDLADLGGLENALDDAGQGILWRNDKQIKQRVSQVHIDRVSPRVELTAEPL